MSLQAISQKSNGNVTLHSGSQVHLNLEVQFNADLEQVRSYGLAKWLCLGHDVSYLERAILLLGLTLVVQVGALLHHLADLVGRHVFNLLVRHLHHV